MLVKIFATAKKESVKKYMYHRLIIGAVSRISINIKKLGKDFAFWYEPLQIHQWRINSRQKHPENVLEKQST